MSRSIHTTHRHLEDLQRTDFASREQQRRRERSAETHREYAQQPRHLARKYAERSDLARAFMLPEGLEDGDRDG